MNKKSLRIAMSIIILSFSFLIKNCTVACAGDSKTNQLVTGISYTFKEDSKYDFSSPDSTSATTKDNTYGEFKIIGTIANSSTKDGFPSYGINGGNIQLSYTYDDSMLNTSEEQEHFCDDKSKTINDISLNDNILKGALILQTSKDGKIWYTIPNETETNLFASDRNRTEPFYITTDTQLINGCYYRVIIAYMTEKKIGTNKFLFIETDDKEYKKYAEVYSFYAYDATAIKVKVPEDDNRMNMGKVVRCTDYDSYGGGKEIDNEDPHSGWSIGSFFVGGYTDCEIDSQSKNTVFLKNNGDKISLWFNLAQNINQCRNNPDIRIVADTKGYDKGFDVPGGVNETMDFGKGVLMIRQKYKDKTYSDPQVYTNFLEAGASPDAVTKVDLFEEGDYEVALDYAVQYDKTKILGKSIAPQTNHYRISFEFEVRNGNTVVFLKDIKTGSDLSNGSITENGFKIDLANSQYLKVHVKREVFKDGFDGLSEDTKFNSSATNGDSFTKEGVYTITVSNQYNKATTEKRVYVGKDNLLKAYMITGLSISEIQDKLALGAIINNDGTIILPEPETEAVVENNESTEIVEETEMTSVESSVDESSADKSQSVETTKHITTEVTKDSQDDTKKTEIEEKESSIDNENDKNRSTGSPIIPLIIVLGLIGFVAVKRKELSKLVFKNTDNKKDENHLNSDDGNDKEDENK